MRQSATRDTMYEVLGSACGCKIKKMGLVRSVDGCWFLHKRSDSSHRVSFGLCYVSVKAMKFSSV